MSTPNRKPLQPVSGSCRWLHEPIAPCELFPEGMPGLLLIETDHVCSVYMLSLLTDKGAVVGFRLTKSDGKVYDIDPAHWTCDCPDGTFRQNRPGGCKHSRALRAALDRLGVRATATACIEGDPIQEYIARCMADPVPEGCDPRWTGD